MEQLNRSSTAKGEQTDDALVEFLEERAGETLRVIAEVERADYTIHHARADLEREQIAERMNRIHMERTLAWSQSDDAVLAGVGEKRATVEIREEAVVVRLLVEAERCYVIELEHSAARNITSFLGKCFKHGT